MRTKEANPFRLAKKHLARTIDDEKHGKKEFMCHALRKVWTTGECNGAAFTMAKRMVIFRLDDHYTVNGYVDRLADAKKIKQRHVTYQNIQFFRHRWLEHLAKEWDKGIRK